MSVYSVEMLHMGRYPQYILDMNRVSIMLDSEPKKKIFRYDLLPFPSALKLPESFELLFRLL